MSLPYFSLCYYLTLQGCVVFCPHSSAPHLTSRTKLRPQSPIPCVSSIQLLDMPFKKACHVCKRRSFAYVMINLDDDGGRKAVSAHVNLRSSAGTGELYQANITMMGKPNSGIARSAQGASQAEFLREGIFRCRAGVGGQGSRAAMESP